METNSDDVCGFQPGPQDYQIHRFQKNGSQTQDLRVQSFQIQDVQMQGPIYHANQILPMVHPNQQNDAMPLIFPQHPRVVNGYYNRENAMQVTLSRGPYQPSLGRFIYPTQQSLFNFVEESIPVNQLHYGYPGMMPDPHLLHRQSIETLTQLGMVELPNGQMEHAAIIYQFAGAAHIEGRQHAQQVDRWKAAREILGDCTPPRAAKPYKRRVQKQGVENGIRASNFKQEAPVSLGQPWEFHEERLTVSQKRNSALSHKISKNLSAQKDFKFEIPTTPKNFTHPARAKSFPSRKERAGSTKTSPKSGQLLPDPPAMPFADPAKSAHKPPALALAMPFSDSVSALPMALSMAVQDKILASFEPVSGRVISFSLPAANLSESLLKPESDLSRLSDIPRHEDLDSGSTSGTLVHNGAYPAPLQDSNHLLSPISSADTSTPISSTLGIGLGDQDNTGMSDEELLFPGLEVPIVAESAAAPTPPKQQDNRPAPKGVVTKASLQEIFQAAGNLDVGRDVFAGMALSIPSPVLSEGQNRHGNIPDPQRDAGFFADYNEQDSGFEFDFDDNSWQDEIVQLQR